jgi:hypothetical protein
MSDMAPSDDGKIKAGTVKVPEDRGGCGKSHTVELDEKDRPRIVCEACAPILVGGHFGWSASPSGVPLTPDEQGEVEIAEREGQVAMRMAMKAMGAAVASQVQGTSDAPKLSASTLVAQLSSMSTAERAEIAALLKEDDKPVVKPEHKAPARPVARKAS